MTRNCRQLGQVRPATTIMLATGALNFSIAVEIVKDSAKMSGGRVQ